METKKTTEALRQEKLALDYSIYRTMLEFRRKNYTVEELLDKYDEQYLNLVLLAFDPQAPELSGCVIENENSRDWFRLGYEHALIAALSVFSKDDSTIADRYAAMIAEFEKENENNIPEEE